MEQGIHMISVVITTYPERSGMLARALASVSAQTLQPRAIIIANDTDSVGAAVNRDRGLASVTTPLVAFLDDDDEMEPHHLQQLHRTMQATRADLVYPWFTVIGGSDPFPHLFGKPYDAETQTTVTFLAKTNMVKAAGGFSRDWDTSVGTDPGVDSRGNRAGEEYRLVRRMWNMGCHIEHHPARTWKWHHHMGNTMGLPARR